MYKWQKCSSRVDKPVSLFTKVKSAVGRKKSTTTPKKRTTKKKEE